MSPALSLINLYVCTKFNFNPFSTLQDMAWTCIYYAKNSYGQITLSIYKIGFGALPFPSLLSIYKPSFILISLVLSKIWPVQASIIKNG